MTLDSFIDAVNDALRRLEGRGYRKEDATVYVSPRTMDAAHGESLYTSKDSVMGMPVLSSREVPKDVVVIVSEARPYDRVVEFARINND